MNYSDFCKVFYNKTKALSGLHGITSQKDIAEFFIREALGNGADEHLCYSDDYIGRWFRDSSKIPNAIWETIRGQFEELSVSEKISERLNEAMLPEIATRLGIVVREGKKIEKQAFVIAVTRQLYNIAKFGGESENIIPDKYNECFVPNNFNEYVKKSYEKYEYMKTLLYTSEARKFRDFFVCNNLRAQGYVVGIGRKEVCDVTLEKLREKSIFSLLVGMGGIGKSMMMRHLFLSSLQSYNTTGNLPVLVILREYERANCSVLELITKSIRRFDARIKEKDIIDLLEAGKCQILLDGLDEIKVEKILSFKEQLDELIDAYPLNQYVMSTRKIDTFIDMYRFVVYAICPFTKDQAISLINKLDFCPEEPGLKGQFLEKLESSLYQTHREFIGNPLLLTLMLMNYHRFAEIPEKQHRFYEQAYQTLVQRHDADKLAYHRIFRSVDDIEDFTKVFSEFCAKSYRHGDYEFDKAKIEMYFSKKMKSIEESTSSKMKLDNFIFDVCHSACLMYEEGQIYYFLHRSFQEYFFAYYYSRQDDVILGKLGRFIGKKVNSRYDESVAFGMLYDLAKERVEHYIFLPYLEELLCENGTMLDYWDFLIRNYKTLNYVYLDMSLYEGARKVQHGYGMGIREYNDSLLYQFILRLLQVRPIRVVRMKNSEFNYSDLMISKFLGVWSEHSKEGKVIVLREFSCSESEEFISAQRTRRSDFVEDENGKYIEFGHAYSIDFEYLWRNKDKYSKLYDYVKDSKSEYYKHFQILTSYYESLKGKYVDSVSSEDDDF